MMIPKEKSGYLDIKLPSKLKSLKWKVWHRRWVVLHQLTNMAATNKPIVHLTFFSKHQVDPSTTNLDNSNNNDTESIASSYSTTNNIYVKGGGQSHSMYLENITAVSRVKSRTRKYAFAVMAGSATSSSSAAALLLSGSSESETQTWMAVLRDAVLPPLPPAFINFPMMLDIGEVYHNAYIIDGESSLKLALSGHYLLAVSQNALGLYSPLDGHLCHEWRFNHLSGYGVSQRGVVTEDANRIFNIVANRSCPSGEGNFSFFLLDAQVVLSQITTSMQRAVLRNTTDHLKDVQTNSNYHPKDQRARNLNDAMENEHQSLHRVSRASGCRLPRRTNNVACNDDNVGEKQADDVHHQRQGSLPCDVELVVFGDSSYCSMEDLRLRDRKDTKSSYSDDNSQRCNLRCHKTGVLEAGERTKCLDFNQNIAKEEDAPCSPTAKVHNNPVGDKPFTLTPESNDDTQKPLSISPGLSAIVGGEGSFLLNSTSYFRRPSWYRDTTNANLESTTSSEDYRELCRSAGSGSGCVLLRTTLSQSLPQTGIHQMPSGHRQQSASNTASHTSGTFCSWANTEGDIEALHRARLGDDHLSESTTSSSNEADDEVELGQESDGSHRACMGGKDDVIRGKCERGALRKSSAASHLYQELPDVKHCCDNRSYCQVCYRRPPTPPELPPRCDMQSPAQSDTSAIGHRQDQADFRSKANSMCCPRDTKYDGTGSKTSQRSRSASENLLISKCSFHGEVISSRDLSEDIKESIPTSMTASPELPTKVGVGGVIICKHSASKKQIDDQNNVPNVIDNDVDPMRKISVLSGLYQDIDSLSEGADRDFNTVTDTPPEPPPRNRNSKHMHGHKFYEDLDRFQKNIHKYLGISISDINPPPPPPLPQRPVSLPAFRQRTKSKLRSLGRKKKAASTQTGAEVHVLSSQTTDDNLSPDLRVGISRMSVWPFRFGSSISRDRTGGAPTSLQQAPPLTNSSSLVMDNNFYTRSDAQFGKDVVVDIHAGSDYYGRRSLLNSDQQNQYTSFSCHSRGALNHLHSNAMAPLPPPPPAISSRTYFQPPPPPASSTSVVQHHRYVSTPVNILSRTSTTGERHYHHHQEVVPNPFRELMRPHLAPWSGSEECRAGDLHDGHQPLHLQQGLPPLYTNSAPADPLLSTSYSRWSTEAVKFSDAASHQSRSACGADQGSMASTSAMPPAEVLEELQRDLLQDETPGGTGGSADSDIYTDMSWVGEEATHLPMLTMEGNINEPYVAEPVYANWPQGEMTESRAFALVNGQSI